MDTLAWLLSPEEPGPRYLALRDVLRRPADDPELRAARAAAHAAPPIAAILDAMHPDGYWEKPGAGNSPKYRSTVWALIALAQCGAEAAADARIGRAAAYLIDHTFKLGGQIAAWGGDTPSTTADCLQGNLLAALLALGSDDPRLDGAFDWMARTVTGEGLAPAEDRHAPRRYYASGKCGPLFACAVNDHQPCAWGGVKVMLALGALAAAPVVGRVGNPPQSGVGNPPPQSGVGNPPPQSRVDNPTYREAIRQGAEYLLSIDPATAEYPHPYAAAPSGNWWKFGFPVFYVTDLLQLVEALAALGYGDDPRLAHARALVRARADADGRWPLEYSYAGKMWDGADFGAKRRPNKWVTIRALRALQN